TGAPRRAAVAAEVLPPARDRDLDHGSLRHGLQPAPRLCRHGLLRTRGVLRRGRVHLRPPPQEGGCPLRDVVPRRPRGGGRRGPALRTALHPPHAPLLLHPPPALLPDSRGP